MKRIGILCLFAVSMIYTAYSQGLTSESLHFDHEFELTDPKEAVFTGYRERVNDIYVATLFRGSYLKVAKLAFSDETLSRKHGALTAYNPKGEIIFISNYKQ